MASASVAAAADSLAGYPVAGDAGFDPNPTPVPWVLGWEFSVSSPVSVTGLAYLDPTGAGLGESHLVGIFDASSQNLLVSATVPSGTAAALQNGFRVVPVSYSLAAGNYVIAGMRNSNADAAMVRATAVTTISPVKYVQERELQTGQFTYPVAGFAANEMGTFGPSFTISGTAPQDTITGVTNAGSFQASFAPGTYASIFGTGLSSTTRAWTPADFANGTNAPTSLDGVSVTINGVKAFVEYVSPTQLNVVVPDMPVTGQGVQVIVTPPGRPAVAAWVNIRTQAPAFFTWPTGTADSGKYVVAQHANYTNVGKTGLFPQQAANFTTPAHAGETLILYGIGFGPTTPALATGMIASQAYALSPIPTATVGGSPAQVLYAGLVSGLAGIYQVNLVLPTGLANGDWPIVVNVNGSMSYSTLVTIQN